MPECYIRGSTIKYLRIPDEVIDMVKEEVVAKGRGRSDGKGRGGGAQRGGRGGNRGKILNLQIKMILSDRWRERIFITVYCKFRYIGRTMSNFVMTFFS